MHHTALALIVIQRPVPGGAIVPHRDGAVFPFEPVMKVVSGEDMRVKVREQLIAFGLFHANHFAGKCRIDVKRFFATERMLDHDGMDRIT